MPGGKVEGGGSADWNQGVSNTNKTGKTFTAKDAGKPEKSVGKKISDGFSRIGNVFSRSTGSKASNTLKNDALAHTAKNASDESESEISSPESSYEEPKLTEQQVKKNALDAVKNDKTKLGKEFKGYTTDANFMKAAFTSYNTGKKGKDPDILQYAGNDLKENKSFMESVSHTNVHALKHAGDNLKNDISFMKNAVNGNFNLKIRGNPNAIQYASAELKGDKNFMLSILDAYPKEVVKNASDDLKNDKDFMLQAYEKAIFPNERKEILDAAGPDAKQYLESRNELMSNLKNCDNDQEFEEAFKGHEEFKNDEGLMRDVSKENPGVLKFANEELKNDEGFMHEAVKNNIGAFKHASEDLRNDKGFVHEAMRPHVDRREREAARHNVQLQGAHLQRGQTGLKTKAIETTFQTGRERLEQLDKEIKEILPDWNPLTEVR